MNVLKGQLTENSCPFSFGGRRIYEQDYRIIKKASLKRLAK
jgi:hypothetical protein